jgi:DnaK suppressor protein
LPVEYALETKLQKIKNALERIDKGTYGTCQNCGKKITIERLKAEAEAELCIKCAKRGG